ncbi:MAG: DUF5074 domain-containing protein [Armatimonadota bacterium]
MDCHALKTLALAIVPLFALALGVAAQTEDMGNGFRHHGVATPVSNHRGTVATVDGDGNPVVLVWLFDHRGGYGILMIDATTGESVTYPTPFPPGGDCPYASILSSRNRYYTHFNSWFCEFDPTVPGFTFHQQTAPQMAMSMTEDDNGVIWSATYPKDGVVSYNPDTGELRDYGHVYKRNWAQYPRAIAADDQGWIYIGDGSTEGQIIILNPQTGEATPVVPENELAHGSGNVFRATDGKVYGNVGDKWWEFHGGQATPLAEAPTIERKPIITGSQGLFHRSFPGGGTLNSVDLINRKVTVTDAAGQTRTMDIDYESEGAHIMGLAAASDGTISGGTAFPMRFFSYNPATDQWTNRQDYGQANTIAPTDTVFYIGGYGHGYLLEWDPARPWVDTVKDNPECNPRYLAEANPDINRPHDLLVYPDGRHVILAGTPGYGLTGGGLMIWDRQTEQARVLKHEQLIPQHSVMSLAPLPDGKLLCGSTIAPGTGGMVKASLAELFILDLATGVVEWHEPVLPNVSSYIDMIVAPNGLVFGIADRTRLFVFDPMRRVLVKEINTEADFGGSVSQQGTRAFVQDPDGNIYVLFNRGIAQLDPEALELKMLAASPVTIGGGGDWLDGRIYFFSGSHVYSWEVPAAD